MDDVGDRTRVQRWTRRVLLGNDDTWGATLATGPRGIYLLAGLALLLHCIDLATGLNMMLAHGTAVEQNPLARFIMETAGPLGLIQVKLSVVLAGLLLLARTAQAGRPRLARNCLLAAAGLGLLGWASNIVGY